MNKCKNCKQKGTKKGKNLADKGRMAETKKEVRCYVQVFDWDGKRENQSVNKWILWNVITELS